MDHNNVAGLRQVKGADMSKVSMMRSWSDGGELEVPDPYYGDFSGFEFVFELVNAACDGFLATV